MATKRYLPNDGHMKEVDTHCEILIGLNKLIRQYPPIPDTFLPETDSLGLFGGPISVAYLLFRLSLTGSGYETLIVDGHTCIEWAHSYLKLSPEIDTMRDSQSEAGETPLWPDVEPKDKRRTLDGYPINRACGVLSETLCYHALTAVMTREQQHVEKLLSFLPGILEKGGDITKDKGQGGWNEYVYGRAGYLYLLRLVRIHQRDAVPRSAFSQVIDMILSEGPSTPNRWLFVSQPALYLGTGHGWMGIILQILLSDPSYADTCAPWINDILDWQLENGNWPKYVRGTCQPSQRPDDVFIQWGHGAPGIVTSLMSIRPVYSHNPNLQAKIDRGIAKAQPAIWEKGLLTKEPCLCHGAAGNALALTDRRQAGHFLACSTEAAVEQGMADGTFEPSSLASGIHRGLASRIWAMYAHEKGLHTYASYDDL